MTVGRTYITYWERKRIKEMRRQEFTEQDKPIYLWIYDEPTGKVIAHDPITKYRIHKLSGPSQGDGIVYYEDTDGLVRTTKNTRLSKFDRCLNNKVYSFNPDKAHAVGIIKATLKAKLDKYENDYKRFAKAFNKFLSNN